jgi:hypothetical protein
VRETGTTVKEMAISVTEIGAVARIENIQEAKSEGLVNLLTR